MDYSKIAAAGGKLKDKFNASGMIKFFSQSKGSPTENSNAISDSVSSFTGKRSGKDKKRTNIGPGKVLSVRAGDSSADILAKILNFSQKTHELDKINFELEQNYRKEQKQEDERRHKKMMDILTRRQTTRETPYKREKEKGESGFLDFTKPITGLLGKVGSLISVPISLIGTIFKMLGTILTVVKGVASTVTAIVSGLTSIISGVVMFLMEKTVIGVMAAVVRGLVASAVTLVLKRTGSAFGILLKALGKAGKTPLGKAIGLALGAAAAVALNREIDEDIREEYYSPSAKAFSQVDQGEMWLELAKLKEDYSIESKKQVLRGDKEAEADKQYRLKNIQDQIFLRENMLQETLEKAQKENDDYLKSRAQEFANMGLTLDFSKMQRGSFGPILLPTLRNKDGDEIPLSTTILEMGLERASGKAKDVIKDYFASNFEELKSSTYKKFEDVFNETNVPGFDKPIPQIVKETENKLENLQKQMNDIKEDYEQKAATVINNVRSMGTPAQTIDGMPLTARNPDDTLYNAVMSSTVKP